MIEIDENSWLTNREKKKSPKRLGKARYCPKCDIGDPYTDKICTICGYKIKPNKLKYHKKNNRN